MPQSGDARERLLAEVARRPWVHVIDLGGGVATPGSWAQPNPSLVRAMDSVDFGGKTVLDIGCWDGLWSFEAESRGAKRVYATDLVTQRRHSEESTFDLARQIRGSKATYHPDVSVYDVERLGVRDFDVVIYPGVYYHLKDPLLSFARLRSVMKDGATLIVEGSVTDSEDCSAKFFYRKPYLRDLSNWWVPSVSCLREWVECSFFEIEAEFGSWDAGGDNLRYVLTARAVRRADPLYLRPAEGLSAFDLNAYPTTFVDSGAATPARRLRRHLAESLGSGPRAMRLRRWIGKLARNSSTNERV